jgi:hypothetical protein
MAAKKGAKRAKAAKARNAAKPGFPKRAQRRLVSAGRHENKDTRRDLRNKH